MVQFATLFSAIHCCCTLNGSLDTIIIIIIIGYNTIRVLEGRVHLNGAKELCHFE